MASYAFHDLALNVEAKAPSFALDLDRLLEGLSFKRIDGGRPRQALRLTITTSDNPPDIPGIAREAFRAEGFAVLENGSECFVTDGESVFHLRPEQGDGAAHLADSFYNKPALLQANFWAYGLMKLFRQKGLYALHGAGLVSPNKAGVIITGPCGSGKSTLSISLIRAGWGYLSDDALLLREVNNAVEILALRKSFYVDEDNVQRYQDLSLGAVVPDNAGGQRRQLALHESHPDQYSSQVTASVLVFPRIVPHATSTLKPLTGATALTKSFYVAEAARKHVKVVLNGDGGDELFGGYRRHNAAHIRDLIPFSNARVPRMLFRFVRRVAPVPSGFRTGYAFLHRLVRGLGEVDVDCYRDWTLNGYTSSELRRLGWAPCATADASVEEILRGHGVEFGAVSTFLTSVLTADAAGVLPYDLLVKMDIACMSVGLEGRSPFMDEQLWTLANSIPVTRRAGLLTTKPLLRRLAERHLPGEIQTAPKRGFEVPLAAWLASELKPMCHDIVLAGNGLLAQLFRRQELEALLSGRWPLDPGRWARRVWILFMLGMWDRECRDSPAG